MSRLAALTLLLPLSLSAQWTRSTECAKCHASYFAKQSQTRHATALRRAKDSKLPSLLTGSLREPDGMTLRYSLDPAGIRVTAGKNSATASLLLEWAFGSGVQGITPVGRYDGKYIEHRVSWYSRPTRPALTLGHPARPSPDVVSALGQEQSLDAIYRCFNCHATNVRETGSGPDLSEMEPGVQCERCHGPGEQHSKRPARTKILNPGRFDAKSIVLICGECHRALEPGLVSDTPELDNPLSIRFQPVGLMASRCFREGKQLSCITCHEPHEDARPASDPWYTAVCLSCHEAKSPAETECRRAMSENCIPCHMQARSPAPHLRFTDHRIRIY